MPIHFLKKESFRPSNLFRIAGDSIIRAFNLLTNQVILVLFLLTGAIFKITTTGFYAVFCIYVIGYFAERITKLIKKRDDSRR